MYILKTRSANDISNSFLFCFFFVVFFFLFFFFFFFFFFDFFMLFFLCDSLCCGYLFEFHRQVDAIQMDTTTYAFIKK